jgi:hypothetical protein
MRHNQPSINALELIQRRLLNSYHVSPGSGKQKEKKYKNEIKKSCISVKTNTW